MYSKSTHQMYIYGSLLVFFHLVPCFCTFFRFIPYWNEVLQKLFSPSFFFSFEGFLNHLPSKRRTCLLCCRWTLWAMETSTFCAGDEHLSTEAKQIENMRSNFKPHTQLATNDFQTVLMSKWLLLTGTHLWKRVVSHLCTHLQVHYTHKLHRCCNSIFCWTKRSSRKLIWYKKQ